MGFAFKSSILEALAATKVPQGASQTEAWQEVKIAPLVPSSAMLKAKAPVGFAILAKQKRESKPQYDYINPVTGLPMENAPSRPVAVIINNLKKATPQVGISNYELLFEYPAEGEITRLVNVMYDYSKITELGSVRSIRDYFIVGALPLDPVFIHYGHSPSAAKYISENPVTSLNGIRGDIDRQLFWRDAKREQQMGFEHSVLTSSVRIDRTFAAFNVRSTTEKTEPFFDFSGWPQGGFRAESLKVQFIQGMTGTFTWDGSKYLRSQFGAPQVDGTDGSQLTCDTVIVIKTYCKNIPGDADLRRRCDLVGAGSGYVFANGEGFEINWSKAADSEFFVFTYKDGKTTTINPGKVWICVMDTSRSVVYE